MGLGALKDTYFSTSFKSTNFSTRAYLLATNHFGSATHTLPILSFDVSSLAGQTIVLATLRLAFYSSNAEGDTHKVYKLLHDDWVDDEATYNEKSSGVTWTSGAISSADIEQSSPAPASAVIPALSGTSAVEWDITDIVQDAIDNSINVNILVMNTTTGTVIYDSKEATQEADRPKLTIGKLFIPKVQII